MNMNSTKKLFRFGAVSAAVYLGLLATPSQAAGVADGVSQRTVTFGDLNLGSPQGIAVLYSRLKNAARTVCEQDSIEINSVRDVWEAKRCQKAALDRAVLTINSPPLSQLHASKTGVASAQLASK
jgi:UrcA family protein